MLIFFAGTAPYTYNRTKGKLYMLHGGVKKLKLCFWGVKKALKIVECRLKVRNLPFFKSILLQPLLIEKNPLF